MMLKRVRKEDVKNDSFRMLDPLEYCLSCWTTAMHNDPDRDVGMQTMRLPAGESDAYGRDPNEADLAREIEIGTATGAMIDSLPRIQWWAIRRLRGLTNVWDFPNADLLAVGPQAQAALTEKLRRNVVTRVFFL
jgi:hypothetical protein